MKGADMYPSNNRRALVSWKVGIVISIISAVRGLAGAVIGIIAILSK
jgi:hypothetical protein